jgi:hypothetical protein
VIARSNVSGDTLATRSSDATAGGKIAHQRSPHLPPGEVSKFGPLPEVAQFLSLSRFKLLPMFNKRLPASPPRPIQTAKLNCIPVFYTPLMAAENDSFSPSAAKPGAALESWLKLDIPLDVLAAESASVEDIARAHLPAFVNAVLSCRSANGFGNRSEAVAKSLPYTSGAMLAVAREALRNGRVALGL